MGRITRTSQQGQLRKLVGLSASGKELLSFHNLDADGVKAWTSGTLDALISIRGKDSNFVQDFHDVGRFSTPFAVGEAEADAVRDDIRKRLIFLEQAIEDLRVELGEPADRTDALRVCPETLACVLRDFDDASIVGLEGVFRQKRQIVTLALA